MGVFLDSLTAARAKLPGCFMAGGAARTAGPEEGRNTHRTRTTSLIHLPISPHQIIPQEGAALASHTHPGGLGRGAGAAWSWGDGFLAARGGLPDAPAILRVP